MSEVTQKSIEQGKRIFALRIEKGLSQEDLHNKSGISVPYISRIEKGRVNVTYRTLNTMAKALDCSLSYLENGYEENTSNQTSLEDTREIVTYDNTTNSNDVVLALKCSMKKKEFMKLRKSIRDNIDEILYTSNDDVIKTLSYVIEKFNEYSFLMNTIETQDEETQNVYLKRCEKYASDIKEEMQTIALLATTNEE